MRVCERVWWREQRPHLASGESDNQLEMSAASTLPLEPAAALLLLPLLAAGAVLAADAAVAAESFFARSRAVTSSSPTCRWSSAIVPCAAVREVSSCSRSRSTVALSSRSSRRCRFEALFPMLARRGWCCGCRTFSNMDEGDPPELGRRW